MGRMRLNVMISRRCRVIGAGTGAAGPEQVLSGRETRAAGTEAATRWHRDSLAGLGGCASPPSRECAHVFIVVSKIRHPNKKPLFTLSEPKSPAQETQLSGVKDARKICRSCSEIHSPIIYEVTVCCENVWSRGAAPPAPLSHGPSVPIELWTSQIKYLFYTLRPENTPGPPI